MITRGIQTKKSISHLLAEALQKAKEASVNGVVRSSSIERGARERLINASFLTEVIRGWYLLTNPAGAGTTTLWYSNYWEFSKQYLVERFGSDGYCLSTESSLDVYAAQNIISQQLVVITKKPSNQLIKLPHNTSLMLYSDIKNFPVNIMNKDGLNLVPLPDAICRAAPSYFQNQSLNAEICLKLVASSAEISRVLLTSQSPTAANRIAGAYQRLGDLTRTEQIVQDMAAAGQTINPQDPFNNTYLYLGSIKILSSPYVGRLQAMWEKMRAEVVEVFPEQPTYQDPQQSLRIIERLYSEDAYHSLSIEGYQVTEGLIRRIKEDIWNPDAEKSDSEQKNALAAKGYLGAFHFVTASVTKVLKGSSPGQIFAADLQTWYRELFAPLARAQLVNPGLKSGVIECRDGALNSAPLPQGIHPALKGEVSLCSMNPSDLAGYRNNQVYISKSRHVPPPKNAVLDAMDTLQKLLIDEESAAVRAVLGHFFFAFIHPYMDGNGRIARFLMNLMLVSGGYNWTVIRTSEKNPYMNSLEKASTLGEIGSFAKLVASEMAYWKNQVSKMNI